MEPLAFQSEWPFVARVEELRLLANVIAGGGDQPGRPGGAVVFAEAGVGKTRLVRETLDWAAAQGHPTAWAIATRSTAVTPYASLAHVLPDIPFDAHEDATSLHRQFAAALQPPEEGHRLVLAVDDAHLLDSGSSALVLRLVLSASVTLLATVRTGEPVNDSITALWKDGLCRRLDLQRFSASETGEMIRAGIGGEVAMRQIERLAQMSGGNALFIRELVLAAAGSGSLRPVDGVWRWDGHVPLTPRLVDAVGQRLDGLSPTDRTALSLVALGDPLPLSLAERLADPDVLIGIENAGLLRVADEGGRPSCRIGHPLYAEVLLNQLGTVGCRRLMRILADALEQESGARGEDAMRIAMWRLDAGVDVSPEALMSAATAANRAFDHGLAERLARGAVDRGGGIAAAIMLGQALNGQNRFEEAESTLAEAERAALEHGDEQLSRDYLEARFGALFHGLSRPDEALGMLGRAVASRPASGIHHLAAAYQADVLVDGGHLRQTVAVADSVLDDARADDTSVLLCAIAKGQALIDLGLTQSAAAAHATLRSLSARGTPGSSRAAMLTALQELQCLFYDARVNDLATQLEAYAAALADSPDDAQRGLVAMSLGITYLQRGTPLSARRSLHQAIAALGSSDYAGTQAWTLALLAQAEALTGAVAAARSAREASRGFMLTGRSARYELDFVTADAFIEMAEGRVTRAVELALDGVSRMGERQNSRAQVLHLALRLGAPPGNVVGQLEAVVEVTEAALPRLYHEHAVALAERDGAALEQLAERFESLGMWLLAAEAAASASAVHARRAVKSGATRAAARSAALAARCEGARTPGLTVSSPLLPLSRREREIADLAGSGLSNAAIAAHLSVSVRTVESHLYQAFGKLGVTRREELNDVLAPPVVSPPENQ
jgi:DNA-binding CsgD family transcriptional regulator/tetratricopeptide (TPR) repeat protein